MENVELLTRFVIDKEVNGTGNKVSNIADKD